MKTSLLMVVSSMMFMVGAEGALVVVPYIDSVGPLVGMSPVTAGTPVPPALLPAPPGTATVEYKAQGKFFVPAQLIVLVVTNQAQKDWDEVLRIMADTPSERFQERKGKTQVRMQATVMRTPTVFILENRLRNPDLNTPPRIQLDTLDLSPGAQVDMSTVPADMVPGK